MKQLKITVRDLQLAKRLRRLRKQKGLTQEKFAERCHLSTTFIGLLETGQRKPSMKTLQKMASILEVKTKDLIPF